MKKIIFQSKTSSKRSSVKGGSVARADLLRYLDQTMNVLKIKDYCPNGLQVEGKNQISSIALAVTASQNAIDRAAQWGADALLVHHGLFWKNDNPSLIGPLRARAAALIRHDMNLLAYHLPLDIHPTWGNNSLLGEVLGFAGAQAASPDGLIWRANLKKPVTVKQLTDLVATKLKRQPLVVGAPTRAIKTVAWCTGGAQGYFADALALGADAYISGEISEKTTHLARETGSLYVAAGHHATERFGVQALGAHLQEKYQVQVAFFDDDNPV
jgi:dinuclear metal center YbgI/SA1388 family protein